MAESVSIDLRRSAFASVRRQRLLDALRTRSVLPAFLYDGLRSASLWEALHRAHAPSMQESRNESLHRRAFDWLCKNYPVPSGLVSFGCGVAEKESILVNHLGVRLETVCLLDVSADLVATAKEMMDGLSVGCEVRAIVADLAAEDRWSDCYRRETNDSFVFSLFGMMPTLSPRLLLRQLRECMAKGDWAVVDFNLLPETEPSGRAIPECIMNQYDNDECRVWLEASLEEIGAFGKDGELVFQSGLLKDPLTVPQIQATFTSARSLELHLFGETFYFPTGSTLNVFQSNRFQQSSALKILEQEEFEVMKVLHSKSGEDGVYVVRLA